MRSLLTFSLLTYLKVAFLKKIVRHLSFPQANEPFFFLENLNFGDWNVLKNWGCLQIWQLRGLQRQEGYNWRSSTALKIPKILIFKFRKIEGSCVWGNDKCISTFWEKVTISVSSFNGRKELEPSWCKKRQKKSQPRNWFGE